MIQLTRLNKKVFYLNPDLFQCIEETPDTVISLINGDHYLVREKASEVIERIIEYRRTILHREGNPNELIEKNPNDGLK